MTEPMALLSSTGDGVAAIVDVVEKANNTACYDVAENVVVQLSPPGYVRHVDDLQQFLPNPRRATSLVRLQRADALVAWLRRHKTEATTLYVDPAALTAVAIADDHLPGVPGWRQHRATLHWQVTPGAARWAAADRKMLDQDDFAELVESGITEIAEPAGADLLELAQSIKATTNAQFRSDRRLTSGQVQLTYVEEIDARAGKDGQMTIPASITLVYAPFFGAAARKVSARLRYRVTGGKLKLGVVIDQPEQVVLDAVDDEVQSIMEAHADLLVLWGTP